MRDPAPTRFAPERASRGWHDGTRRRSGAGRLTGLSDAGSQRPGTTRKLAFDHARILADGLERARSKLEYTPLATSFVAEPFSISELRMVYEAVWGEPLHAGNFHRKVLSVPGFVESTGETTETGGPRGGPRARLYRRGDARLLHPALLRPGREEAVR
jgi:8-oxo-dGTP diphosphatase